MNYETITVRPLAGALGAEIAGVDLRQKLSNRQWSEVRQAFLDHCAIYIRDQDLGGDDLLRYARYFAEPAFYPFAEGLPDYPQIFELRKEPDQLKNVGGRWHSDTTYLDKPPIGTMLYAREVPAYGGDTMVANQYLAYETLSAGMRAMLDGLTGVYSAGADRTGREENKNMKMRNTAKTEQYVAEHPVVRTHPDTGRKALYVNTEHTIRFKGMTAEESLPLIEFLQAHCTRPEFTARIRWERARWGYGTIVASNISRSTTITASAGSCGACRSAPNSRCEPPTRILNRHSREGGNPGATSTSLALDSPPSPG